MIPYAVASGAFTDFMCAILLGVLCVSIHVPPIHSPFYLYPHAIHIPVIQWHSTGTRTPPHICKSLMHSHTIHLPPINSHTTHILPMHHWCMSMHWHTLTSHSCIYTSSSSHTTHTHVPNSTHTPLIYLKITHTPLIHSHITHISPMH